eukprot:TRINITY_DN9523_c0_g1_i1.p1 TRINITY_DN9523_c0_g1~~TRINITY_DN9523_c0_g1_i1.p1  ORF type:complete len:308 (+),score=68.82 TRINITY_DN9523_c0_g1_i1:77-1000(+)
MSEEIKPGDHVSWNSSSGTVDGTVVKKVTSDTQIKSHHVAATKEEPQYIVKSDSTGALAAHKPEALHPSSPSPTKQTRQVSSNTPSAPAKQQQTTGAGTQSTTKQTANTQVTSTHTATRAQTETTAPEDDSIASRTRSKTGDADEEQEKQQEQEQGEEEEEEQEKVSKRKAERGHPQAPAATKKARTVPATSNGPKQTEDDELVADFKSLVNMTIPEISEWLGTKESNEVGMVREGESESVGHQSGRKIIQMLSKDPSQWTEEEVQHAHKVRSYIKRHMAQQPQKEDLEHTRWTYSLKNWGHDPIKH